MTSQQREALPMEENTEKQENKLDLNKLFDTLTRIFEARGLLVTFTLEEKKKEVVQEPQAKEA